MHRLRDSIAKTYFSLDTRSLALFRVLFASVLLVDLFLRSRVLDAFYSNEGLLPNHTLLWAPLTQHMFSLFFTASHHDETWVLMVLCAIAFFCLLVGYRTRLAHVASWIGLVSLDARIVLLENGGDVVMNLLCMWTLFLPLGERFSIDSLLRSMRTRKEHAPAQLNERSAFAAKPADVYSLACCAVLLQLIVIYFFNVVHKSGPTWLDGSAVHYTLHQDRLVKPFGIWLREHLPPEALQALTWGSIGTEALGTVAIASPILTRYTRLLAVVLMPLLHLGFELCLDLGVFSFVMMSLFALLVAPEHWRFLYRSLSRRHALRRVYVDADCGFCMLCARVLSRLDVFGRLQFASNADAEQLPPGVSLELADTTIVVLDIESGRVHQRAAAFAALFRSLAGGFLIAWPLRVPGLRQLADAVYDRVARNRLQISLWLGYRACGIPLTPSAAGPTALDAPQANLCWGRARRVLREGCVALLMLAAAAEALNANSAVPERLHFARPQWLMAMIEYPRALQAWRMFAPHAPLEDFMIEVDAETQDGRHVDPYNEIASRVHGPGLKAIPPYLHQNQFFTAYSLFIWMPPYAPYLSALRDWILRYPIRTRRPSDGIVRFKVYKLSDSSPPPGQTQPSNFRREPFLSYPP
jgi:predicted DCC family thiol-disulfide oxidoreductase YuxK